MPLTDQEKNELSAQLQLLADLGEPEAMVGELRKACMRKANDSRTPASEAMRWIRLANALLEAEATVNAAQSPEAHKLAEHMRQWSGDAGQGQLHANAGQGRPGPQQTAPDAQRPPDPA
jgi:hypothetical protein